MIQRFLKHRLFPLYLVFLAFTSYLLNEMFFNSEIGGAILGFLIIFLVPGYSWIRGLYTLPLLEEFVLSSAISISINIISLTFLNMLFSVPVTKEVVFLDLLAFSVLGLLVTYKNLLRKYMD